MGAASAVGNEAKLPLLKKENCYYEKLSYSNKYEKE
jgi:hypothetical protein